MRTATALLEATTAPSDRLSPGRREERSTTSKLRNLGVVAYHPPGVILEDGRGNMGLPIGGQEECL
jgi:hypothetical protein